MGTIILPNFIIAGTNKSGTGSVFTYLGDHPEVSCSGIKETNFFIREYTGNPDEDQKQYARYFASCDHEAAIIAEASPAYLSFAETVAPRIRKLAGNVNLLFILRDPVERLYSFYHSHVARFLIPENMPFDEFVRLSSAYEQGTISPADYHLRETQLMTMRSGRYSLYLSHFYRVFPSRSVRVMFYDHLRDDPKAFMKQLSALVNIDPSFYETYHFKKANITITARNNAVHRLAMRVNRTFEKYLRKAPGFKALLREIYAVTNVRRQGYPPMEDALRNTLKGYYAESIDELSTLYGLPVPPAWKQ